MEGFSLRVLWVPGQRGMRAYCSRYVACFSEGVIDGIRWARDHSLREQGDQHQFVLASSRLGEGETSKKGKERWKYLL